MNYLDRLKKRRQEQENKLLKRKGIKNNDEKFIEILKESNKESSDILSYSYNKEYYRQKEKRDRKSVLDVPIDDMIDFRLFIFIIPLTMAAFLGFQVFESISEVMVENQYNTTASVSYTPIELTSYVFETLLDYPVFFIVGIIFFLTFVNIGGRR